MAAAELVYCLLMSAAETEGDYDSMRTEPPCSCAADVLLYG